LTLFTLGVVQAGAERPADVVARSFRRALTLTRAASLREDCYQRLIEAELAGENRKTALATFARYETEFPEGRHRQRLRTLISSTDAEPNAAP
jgi:hypothetical protein